MDSDNLVDLETQCTQCNKTYHTRVKREAYLKRLEKKGLVQDLFPELSRAERELFFVSGVCGPCFIEMFGPGPS